jgi:hypothetical protein
LPHNKFLEIKFRERLTILPNERFKSAKLPHPLVAKATKTKPKELLLCNYFLFCLGACGKYPVSSKAQIWCIAAKEIFAVGAIQDKMYEKTNDKNDHVHIQNPIYFLHSDMPYRTDYRPTTH